MATASAHVAPATGETKRPELAGIVRARGTQFRATRSLTSEQLQALNAIENCRTPALGGHLERCTDCGFQRLVYHSCRNRHCPKCQVLAKERWLDKRRADLLPVQYFHVVFTLPHQLNGIARIQPSLLYDLLFRCAAQTLQAFARKHLGGSLGITAILHTWNQRMQLHPHVHCLVTGGALTPDGSWCSARNGFLFPVRALSKVFQAKMLAGLAAAKLEGKLNLVPSCPKRWNVYSKAPFAGPQQVLQYLGRYTHRIALSNERILAFDDRHVKLSWRDRSDGNRSKVLELTPEAFLARFLQHVLPRGFVRIRHYGLHANRCRRKSLDECRILLGADPPEPPSHAERESVVDLVLRLTGQDLSACPACGHRPLQVVRTFEPGELPITAFDTS